MIEIQSLKRFACVAVALSLSGCHSLQPVQHEQAMPTFSYAMPRELSKVVLPEYTIEPPDILAIEAINAVPKSPYRLQTLDVLSIEANGTLPDSPVTGAYPIEPGGTVNLGIPYGTVSVTGMTVAEAEAAISQHLEKYLTAPDVAVALAELGASQQILGEYLVGPDGTVTLGAYGNVSVVGMTLAQAKATIEMHLSQYLDHPDISLNVVAFNSKVFYIVLQGAGLGDGVYRMPITGNETVLDAIAQINGLETVSSKKIWVARPSHVPGESQILPVDWYAITEQALPDSNYQILPGDRVFVSEDKLIAFDNGLAKLMAPLERLMGFTLLGAETATRFSGPVLRGGGNPRGFGGF